MRVLMLDLDTLRPDHLGCYGYRRDTSPNIDRVAAEGVRFDNYYTPDAPCLPARAALVSGMFGIHNGAVGHGGTCADMRLEGITRGFRTSMAENSLWKVFRKAGMSTCTISPFAERHSSFWFLAGFNEMHNHAGKGGMESAEEVTPVVMKWIEDNADKDNWLLHVNFWDPHTPYRAPAEFANPFADDPLPEWLTPEVHAAHLKLAGPHTAHDNNMYNGDCSPQFPRHPGDLKDSRELRRCIDGYDCGIRYMDQHIGQILDSLEKKGILNDTAVVITSDHGENFGELGIYSEHGTADNMTCRIPMIIKWPGMKKGLADKGLHYNLDLAP
ncbi:MAG: sulfatase, partial [Victivallales bacterium]|nr:sulfatase [Victivallales bacterium]